MSTRVAMQEVVFPLAGGGTVRIVAPRSLTADDVRIMHGLIDLLSTAGHDS